MRPQYTFPKPLLTQERLRRLVHYDPQTGIFTRLVALSHNSTVGEVLGTVWHKPPHDLAYLYFMVDGKRYQAHRLAWLYMTGKWPSAKIDHWDHDGTNNRWVNLRDATQSQNLQNARMRSDNTSGVKGVSWSGDRRKWVAQFTLNGKRIGLGRFDSKDDAIAAYRAAAEKHFGEFANLTERANGNHVHAGRISQRHPRRHRAHRP